MATAATIRRALLKWYQAGHRDLPWRHTKDPYAIWVSEIMLQQTRVETVIGYYKRFLQRFPTADALAAADEDEVMALWSGLGYYRRARLLHRGVREVVAQYGGAIPKDPVARLSLPGIGRYTCGAIGSIAFDQAEPIVDGNVARVLCRVHAIESPIGATETTKRLWHESANLVSGPHPGDFNQALMELGATICTPKQPACTQCPLRRSCETNKTGRQAELPIPKKRTKVRTVKLAAVGATRAGHVWLTKSQEELFGGLWCFPTQPGSDRVAAKQALRAHDVKGRLQPTPRGEVTHVLSHRRLEVTVWRATAATAKPSDTLRAFRLDELGAIGASTLTKKIAALLQP